MIFPPAAAAALIAVSLAAAAPIQAQDYPARPIRMVRHVSPGGWTDLLARLLGQRFQASWGQPTTIDNRAGAGGNSYPVIVSPTQLAEIVGVSRKTIELWKAKDRLKGSFRKRGKHVLFWRDKAIDLIFNGPDWSH